MRAEGRGRAGKSLLELLIALTIIGLMLCLMVPAAFKVMKAALALGT